MVRLLLLLVGLLVCAPASAWAEPKLDIEPVELPEPERLDVPTPAALPLLLDHGVADGGPHPEWMADIPPMPDRMARAVKRDRTIAKILYRIGFPLLSVGCSVLTISGIQGVQSPPLGGLQTGAGGTALTVTGAVMIANAASRDRAATRMEHEWVEQVLSGDGEPAE